MEVTKFINNCMQNKQDQINAYKTPTLFGNNDAKISLCCLILLSGQSIQEGFGFVIRIKQVILYTVKPRIKCHGELKFQPLSNLFFNYAMALKKRLVLTKFDLLRYYLIL